LNFKTSLSLLKTVETSVKLVANNHEVMRK